MKRVHVGSSGIALCGQWIATDRDEDNPRRLRAFLWNLSSDCIMLSTRWCQDYDSRTCLFCWWAHASVKGRSSRQGQDHPQDPIISGSWEGGGPVPQGRKMSWTSTATWWNRSITF